MKNTVILLSAFVGVLLGTTVGIATASPRHSNAAADRRVMVVTPEVVAPVQPTSVVLPEVTIVGKAARVPRAAKAKTWQCGAWQESSIGGQYKACEWK